MKAKSSSIAAAFLGILVIVGLFLFQIQTRQKIGQPGLKVGSRPIHDEKGQLAGSQSVDLPLELPGYTSTEEAVTTTELNWLPKDTVYGRRLYKTIVDGFQCAISVVLMGKDRTSIHKPQFCLVGQGWTIDKSEVITIPIARPSAYELKAMKMTLSKPAVIEGKSITLRGIYLYWFVAEGQMTPHHGQRMWWMARDLMTAGVLQRWAYVTYFCVCLPEKEGPVLERMKGFVAESLPHFQMTAGKMAQTSGVSNLAGASVN